MKMSRRELNKQKCREKILKASRRLFSAKGYDDTMIEEVAIKAEISKATLYNYFPSKESLLVGIAEDELDQIRDYLENELSEVDDPAEKLLSVLESFIMDCISYINLSRKITYLNSCEESSLYASRVDLLKIFRSLVVDAQERKIFRSDISADDIVDIVMSVYLMAQFEWSHISDYSEEYCREKLHRVFSEVLSGIYL